ncbi:hypothetical protein M569_03532, partial [Genlisea aurea]
MGSSDTGGGLVDCSVGSIVWVRRRNGSWWPGKILGPEELSVAHVSSPRSGTPVKLLGREDASVDWYNLEKSKRVKPFRCGEFDACIERAEAAQGMPPKKREKYARREDAILHALELERHTIEKKYGKLEVSSWARSKMSPDAITSSDYLVNCGENKITNAPDYPCDGPGSSHFTKNEMGQQMPHEETLRDGNQLSGEDDSAGMLPRMRGLQDFGLYTAPSTGEECSGVAHRAKRSKYSHVPNDPLPSSPMEIDISKVQHSAHPAAIGEDQVSGSTEDTETDCSETDSVETDSDEELTALSDHGSISSSDDIDSSAYVNGLVHHFPHNHGADASKWQLKGKRKTRNLGKKSMDNLDSEYFGNIRNVSRSSSAYKADLNDKRAQNPRASHNSNEFTDSEAWSWNSQNTVRGYRDDSPEYGDPPFVGKHYLGGRLMLVDVDLQVNANNYRRNVSMISLTSKLNGHAIVGHPVQVEPLEAGSTANLVSGGDFTTAESPALPSVWRTGRRTANFRIPRPFSSMRLNGDRKVVLDGGQHVVVTADHGQKKFSRNSPKKISASSPGLKIRSLSSIPAEDRHRKTTVEENEERAMVIKTENVVSSVVACIPVNLVFSRLHEELIGRHQ